MPARLKAFSTVPSLTPRPSLTRASDQPCSYSFAAQATSRSLRIWYRGVCCIGAASRRASGWRDDLSPLSSGFRGLEFGLQGLPVPARDHRPGGALVPALRAVLSRSRGAAGGAGHRGRSRDRVSVGAVLNAAPPGRGPAEPHSA